MPVGNFNRLKRHLSTLRIFAVFMAFAMLTPWILKDVKVTDVFLEEIPGPLYPILILFFFGFLGYGLILLYKGYQRASGIKKNQLRYMFFGYFFGFVSGISYFLCILFPSTPPIFYLPEVLYVAIVAYAIIQFRLMDINLVFRRVTVGAFFSTIVFIPLALAMWFGRNHIFFQLCVTFFSVLLIPLIYKNLRGTLFDAVDQLRPFKGRYKNLAEVDVLRKMIAGSSSIPEWATNVSFALSELIETDYIGVFLNEAGFYHPVRYMGGDVNDIALHSPLESSPFIQYISKSQSLVMRDEIPFDNGVKESEAVMKDMDSIGARLCAPLHQSGHLSGFLTLGPKIVQGKKYFTEKDFDFKRFRFVLEFSSRMERNQVILNRLIIEKLGGEVDRLPETTDAQILKAINAVVSIQELHKKIDLGKISLTGGAGRLLRRVVASSGGTSLESGEVLVLNTAIVRSLYADAFNPALSEDMFNEEDLKAIWRIAQDAEQMLMVIESSIHQKESAADWAHDLKHPFVKGGFRLLPALLNEEMGRLSDEQRSALSTIMEDASFIESKLSMLINPDSNIVVLKPLGLIALFDHVISRFQYLCDRAGIQLVVSAPSESVFVNGDCDMLVYRVVNNLMTNALQNTPAGGSIEIGHYANGVEIVCFVKNKGGPLIPSSLIPRIFERGDKGGKLSTNGGTGLGLYNVSQVIQEHGGRVWVESREEIGNVFYFSLRIPETGNPSNLG